MKKIMIVVFAAVFMASIAFAEEQTTATPSNVTTTVTNAAAAADGFSFRPVRPTFALTIWLNALRACHSVARSWHPKCTATRATVAESRAARSCSDRSSNRKVANCRYSHSTSFTGSRILEEGQS